jgi:hypothetical protein
LVYPKILKTFRKNFWKEFIDEWLYWTL